MFVNTHIKYGKRPIKDGSAFERYFDLSQLKYEEKIEMGSVSVYDTLKFMETIAKKYQKDTKKLTRALMAKELKTFLKAIHTFVVENIQYTKDKPNIEQVSRPLRLWAERSGQNGHTDCDCMSVFISSMLINAGVKHRFRITGYSGSDFQHVYVVVPTNTGKEYVLDGVVHQFDVEVPYTKKFDTHLIAA